MNEANLFVDLSIALAAGLVGAVLAAGLRQPVILGYVAAGIAIGPYTPGPVGDVAVVEQLADIGIILLMFAVGVQVSIRDLLHAGRVGAVAGVIQVLVVMAAGYGVGLGLGWRAIEALFLGAIVAISSSVVVTKTLAERGEAGSRHGQLALAWMAVQDLVLVVIMVVLSALAEAGDSIALDVSVSLAKSIGFLAVMMPVGLVVLPWFFRRVAALGNREIFVLSVAAVAFGTAYGASAFGISLALGAFVAGVVVSESDLSHQVLGQVMPIRDVFAVLFFVSVGMLVDPAFVASNAPLVLLVAALAILLKGAVSMALVAMARRSVRTSLLTGVLVGQSGEFSILLARLGRDLDALATDAFNASLSAVVVSMVLMPLAYPAASRAGIRLEARARARRARDYVPEPPSLPALRGHAVICGYGEIGQLLGAALARRGFPFAVVDEDPRLVRRLRQQGITAVQGAVENPVVLGLLHLSRARVLVVTVPDPVAVRLVVDHAKALNPTLDIVVRTHSTEERGFLLQRGVAEAVIPEVEVGIEITRHAIQRFGVSGTELQLMMQGLRHRARENPAE